MPSTAWSKSFSGPPLRSGQCSTTGRHRADGRTARSGFRRVALRRYGVAIATNSISVVRLTEREQDRLLIFSAAELARRHRAAGLLLSAPEAIALMCDAMFEAARAGGSYADAEAAGYDAVSGDEVMDGVPALVDEVRLEVLLGDGTRLIVLRNPLGAPPTADSHVRDETDT